jgi:hypothetical protein
MCVACLCTVLSSNPAYVRAILRSYVQYKVERKTTLVQSPAGWVQKVNLWEVGKKLDSLERILIKQGVSTTSGSIMMRPDTPNMSNEAELG